MSRDGSSSRLGFTFISWKKRTVPKSAEESGPPLCPDWERARSAMMSRRTKRARSLSSCKVISSRGMRLSTWLRCERSASTLPDRSSSTQPDSRSRIVVSAFPRVGDHPRAYRARDLLDPITDALTRPESPLPLDPVEAYPVGAPVFLLGINRHPHPGDVRLELFFQVAKLVVLEVVSEVQDRRRIAGQRFLDRHDDPARDIRHMYEGSPLCAAEDLNRPFAYGLLGEKVHREIEPHAWGEPVDRAEAEDDGLELRIV